VARLKSAPAYGFTLETELTQLTFDFHAEKPEIVAESADSLGIRLGEFAGPLDLLLYLIKQDQANIFDIPVARITDQYLQYLRLMQKLDITVAGDFLVMAATLIEIKSKMLLPRDPVADGEEEPLDDPRKELVDRLLEHQKFKNAAELLWSRATVERAVFTRGKIETDEDNSEISATVFDLINIFQKMLARQQEEISMEIEREEKTIQEMLAELRENLETLKELNFNHFMAKMRSKRELVLAFMAILELVKNEALHLLQDRVFGDIILRKI
jgi:segregation and condensation protein A